MNNIYEEAALRGRFFALGIRGFFKLRFQNDRVGGVWNDRGIGRNLRLIEVAWKGGALSLRPRGGEPLKLFTFGAFEYLTIFCVCGIILCESINQGEIYDVSNRW